MEHAAAANAVAHTVAVFEIVPYPLTHYSLYSVHDIVHYLGNEQTRIRTLRLRFLNVICVSKCAGYLCDADRSCKQTGHSRRNLEVVLMLNVTFPCLINFEC